MHMELFSCCHLYLAFFPRVRGALPCD